MVSDMALFTIIAYNASLMRMPKKTEVKCMQIEISQFFLDNFWPTS